MASAAPLQNGYRLEDEESRELTHDGTPKVFLNNLVGIVQEGHLLGAWGTQRDVTEQRHAEKERKHGMHREETAEGVAHQEAVRAKDRHLWLPPVMSC
ncbi:hypothetical protein ACN28E_10115 [Archangium lansingense]|uniref:hypothetical protein n=1 Tax=Archangium lansingense TaxID=2995310 RepID=UPI003B78E180